MTTPPRNMTCKAFDLVSSLMANIDDLKDKINDGEYLTLSNLLKDLHLELKEIKELKEEPNEVEVDDDDDDDEDEDELNNQIDFTAQNETLSNRLLSYFTYLNHNFENYSSYEEVIDKYNSFLGEVAEQEEETNYNRWFICGCGCSVSFNSIKEHLDDENHRLNFGR